MWIVFSSPVIFYQCAVDAQRRPVWTVALPGRPRPQRTLDSCGFTRNPWVFRVLPTGGINVARTGLGRRRHEALA
jgi:hypothetical protein